MLRYTLLIFIIIIIGFLYSVLYNYRFGKTLPLVYITLILLQLISGYLGGVSYIKVLLPLFIMVLIILSLLNKKINKETFLNYLSPGLFIYLFFSIYLYFLLKNVGLTNIDDTFHWSQVVKGCLKTNLLLSDYQYTSSYPPFTALIEIVYCKFLGGYNDSYVILALSSFSVSFMFPLLDKYKKEDFLKTIIIFISSICILLSINQSAYQNIYIFNSIYADWIMAILFAYGLYLIYESLNNNIDYLSLCAILICLTLIKPASILLCILIFITLLFIKKINGIKLCISDLYVILLPALVYSSWIIYTKISINTYSHLLVSDNIFLFSIDKIFNSINLKIAKEFLTSCIKSPLINQPIKMSYFIITILFFIINILLCKIFNKKKVYYFLAFIIFIYSIIYAIGMMLTYMFVFEGIEAETLVMFTRYMQIFSFANLIVVYYLLVNCVQENKMEIIPLLFSLLFIEPTSVDTIIISSEPRNYKMREKEIISNYVQQEYNNEKIIILNQTDMVYRAAIEGIFTYEGKEKNLFMFDCNNYGNYSLKDIINLFSDYDLLLVGDYDEYFYKNYWSKITNLPLYNSTLYKINKSNNSINFEYIYVWEE